MKVFNSINGIKSHFIKVGCLDCFKFKGVIYSQEEYDFSGKIITYKNKRTTNEIDILTENNRYKNGFKDCEVVFTENTGFYRNDITFID